MSLHLSSCRNSGPLRPQSIRVRGPQRWVSRKVWQLDEYLTVQRAFHLQVKFRRRKEDMDRPGDSQKQPTRQQQDEQPVKVVPPSYRSLYLIAYNATSALLWSVVLGRVLSIWAIHGYRNVYTGAGEWTKWTQTLAALEIVHAAIGMVRCFNLRTRTNS